MPGTYRSEKGPGPPGRDNHAEFQVVDGGASPTTDTMRQLRRDAASAVTVVTFADDRGLHGVTVSAFTLVSLSPPRVLICLGPGSDALAAIQSAGHFAVSVLGDRQEFLAEQFAGRAPAVNASFAGVKHQLSKLGDPIPEDCLVWFSASIDGASPQGDHVVVFGEVKEAGYGLGREPLLYFDGAYRSIQFD